MSEAAEELASNQRAVAASKASALAGAGLPLAPGATSVPAAPAKAPGKGAKTSRVSAAPARRVEARYLGRGAGDSAAATSRQAQPFASGAAAGPATPQRQDAVTGVEKGGTAERQDWVHQLLDGLWPYARDAAERLGRELIPEQLEASRPSFVYTIEMQEFTLGEAQPAVRDIRVHAGAGAGAAANRDALAGATPAEAAPVEGSELFLEFEVEWRSQQDISLLITVPRLPVAVAEITPDPVEDALRLMLRLRVALRDAWVRAGVRVTLRPLLRRLPVVGAIQVGLTRLPEFGYELDLSLASAALVPLLRNWIDAAVRDLVLQPWVLPEHWFLPLDPEAKDVERPAGVLSVRVLGASQIPKPGMLGSCRPMLELFLRATQRRQTCVAPSGREASWGSPRFEFPVSVPEHQELTVTLYSYNDWSPNEEMGRASLALRDLPPGQERKLTLQLRSTAEKKHEEESRKLSGLDRLALAAARPFTKKGADVCQLHLQVSYTPLTEEQSRLVMEQQRLPVPQRAALHAAAAAAKDVAEGSTDTHGAAGPATLPPGQLGRQQQQQQQWQHPVGWEPLPPAALRLLGSGMLIVAIPQAEGLLQGRRAGLFKPYFKAVLRVGERQAESDAAQASRQGAVQFSLPVALHLPAEVLQDERAQAELELLEHGWMGSPASRGRLALSLRELAGGARAQGCRRLGSGGAELQLDARFQPYF
ncbi:hypothetical protein ABPG75_000419 [Micractinium tetrahymenae]